MSTADILAITGVVQAVAWPAAALAFGLRALPQLRVAAPQKQAETLRQAEAVKSIAEARKGAA